MTTLIGITSRHAVVMGCDSLGTSTKYMVDPNDLVGYFDPANNWAIRSQVDGKPVLSDIYKIMAVSQEIPYKQLLHVNKLFHLKPLPVGAMFTGITSIGQRSIRSLIEEFIDNDPSTTPQAALHGPYKVGDIAQRLLDFLRGKYEVEFKPPPLPQPGLELLIGGYDSGEHLPTMWRVDVRQKEIKNDFPTGTFGASFAGQRDWIERIVFGSDHQNKLKLIERSRSLMEEYRQRIQDDATKQGLSFTVPNPKQYGDALDLFNGFDLNQLTGDWAELTEQNAIDTVDFFVDIMIKSQRVTATVPTVGGQIHVAVIRRDGFYLVSEEVWKHGENVVDVPEVRNG